MNTVIKVTVQPVRDRELARSSGAPTSSPGEHTHMCVTNYINAAYRWQNGSAIRLTMSELTGHIGRGRAEASSIPGSHASHNVIVLNGTETEYRDVCASAND